MGYNDKNGDTKYEFPLDLSVACPLKKGIEFLFICSMTPAINSSWVDTERAVKLGVNITATGRLEVLTEMGWVLPDKGFTIGLGLIYTLPDNKLGDEAQAGM